MKKLFRRVVVLSCISFLMCYGMALAQGPYISGNVGISILSDSDISDSTGSLTLEFDPGFASAIAAGYDFGLARLEGEIGYQTNDIDKIGASGVSISASGDVSSTSFLVNGYYDFTNSSQLTPYISAGIGVAQVEVNDLAVLGIPVGSEDDTVFAYQLGVGVGYSVTDAITLDMKYRYFATADPDFDGIDGECASHNVYLGLRYNF